MNASEGSDLAKRKMHIVWNEDNLSYNEANKSAKMKIDEPETPWASPPKELFEDPDGGGGGGGGDGGSGPFTGGVTADDVADRLMEIERDVTAAAGSAGASGAAGGSSRGADDWESSDGEGDATRGGARRPKLSFPDPRDQPGLEEDEEDTEMGVGGAGEGGGWGRGGISTSDDGDGDGDGDGDEGPLDDMDKVLKARLFEAQRKSHQCTFKGVMARGRALLDEELGEENA